MGPIKPSPAKMLLRNEIANKIAALSSEEKRRQSQIVFEKVTAHPWYTASRRIALFMSTDEEIDTAPLIAHVKARGAAAFIPQYAGGHMKMLKLEDEDGSTLAITKHGIAQHGKDVKREDALESGGLDLVIAPGVAFTKTGCRLGHGGGYYDKFLEKVRSDPETAPKVVALAFNCQVVEELPMDGHDQKIDGVIYAD